MRTLFWPFLILVAITPQLLMARIVKTWTYREMLHKADLVVIATFESSKDTAERRTLEDITPAIEAIGVESEFESRIILKGDKGIRKFRLHHYRIENAEQIANGPRLVEVESGKHPAFLLFLVREEDGRYAPVTGQTDPTAFSVLELNSAAQ
jgi:hypothetical protein